MRKANDILTDHQGYERLTLETLLDIRDILEKTRPKKERRKKRISKKEQAISFT